MVEILWTEAALSDLDAIADYIALDKPDAASRLVQRVFQHLEMLATHPGLGWRVPELRRTSRH
jgi:plasmid stabilization system protein ParE